jgi:hypothetical protein
MGESIGQAPVPEESAGSSDSQPTLTRGRVADTTGGRVADTLVMLVRELDSDYKDLSAAWPADDETDPNGFWRVNLAKIKLRIDAVQDCAESCRKLTGDKAGDGQKDALRNLDTALREARIYTQAALSALRVRDDASQSLEKSRRHMDAVDQLASLASYCKVLIPHLLARR